MFYIFVLNFLTSPIVSHDHSYRYYLDFAMNHCIICKLDDKKTTTTTYTSSKVVLIDGYMRLYHRSVLYENLLNTSPDIDPLDRCAVAATYDDYVSIISAGIKKEGKKRQGNTKKKKMHLELKFCSQAQGQAEAQTWIVMQVAYINRRAFMQLLIKTTNVMTNFQNKTVFNFALPCSYSLPALSPPHIPPFFSIHL